MIHFADTEHIMLDIETLGTKPGCAVLSVGVARMRVLPNGTAQMQGDPIEWGVDLTEQLLSGAEVDPATVRWWQHEDRAAACAMLMQTTKLPVRQLHSQLGSLLTDKTQVWANSPEFDCAIMNHLFVRMGLQPLWKFWQTRDLRTLTALQPLLRVRPDAATAHTAAGDADAQARTVVRVINALNGKHDG